MPTSSRPGLKTVANSGNALASGVFNGPEQRTLEFDPGLTERFRNLRDVIAQGVYQRGLKRIAAEMEMSPGNLSAALSDNEQRHVSTDALERYIETTGDTTPILWLIARYMPELASATDSVQTEIRSMQTQMQTIADAMAKLQAKGRR